MKDVLKSIRETEENIEEVLNTYEIKEENKKALELYKKLEIEAARNSEDEITLARSVFSSAIQNISSGNINEETLLLEEALQEFNKGNSFDHKQGAGWIWIIRADIMNAGITEADHEEIVETCNKAIKI